MALNRVVGQVVMIAGPTLAGVVAAGAGVRGCYLADVASFAGALWGVGRLPAMPPESGPATAATATAQPAGAPADEAPADEAPAGGAVPPGGRGAQRSGLALTVEGLAFIRRTPVLLGAFLTDVNATFFALPTSLFPAINAERFGGNPRTLGLFMTAIGVGGLVSAVFAGPLKHARRHGLVMLVCVAVWGGGFALFAVAPSLWLTLLALAVAGLADTFTVVVRSTIVQEATPDEFRGRVNAADFLVGLGGGELGSLEAGLVGSWTTPMISALSGGLLTIAGAMAIGIALPAFRRYQSPGPAAEPTAGTDPPAAAEPPIETTPSADTAPSGNAAAAEVSAP
jgi:hypothetical protein